MTNTSRASAGRWRDARVVYSYKSEQCNSRADVRLAPNGVAEAELREGREVPKPRHAKQGPRVPLTGLREDDGKCAPCLSYPPPVRRCLRRVGGRQHRLSQIRPLR